MGYATCTAPIHVYLLPKPECYMPRVRHQINTCTPTRYLPWGKTFPGHLRSQIYIPAYTYLPCCFPVQALQPSYKQSISHRRIPLTSRNRVLSYPIRHAIPSGYDGTRLVTVWIPGVYGVQSIHLHSIFVGRDGKGTTTGMKRNANKDLLKCLWQSYFSTPYLYRPRRSDSSRSSATCPSVTDANQLVHPARHDNRVMFAISRRGGPHVRFSMNRTNPPTYQHRSRLSTPFRVMPCRSISDATFLPLLFPPTLLEGLISIFTEEDDVNISPIILLVSHLTTHQTTSQKVPQVSTFFEASRPTSGLLGTPAL